LKERFPYPFETSNKGVIHPDQLDHQCEAIVKVFDSLAENLPKIQPIDTALRLLCAYVVKIYF